MKKSYQVLKWTAEVREKRIAMFRRSRITR